MKHLIFSFSVFFSLSLFAQETYTIKGTLIDSCNNNPVDYANIGIQGKNLGTVSNDSGYFELEIADKFLEDSLTFSRIGYATKKIDIENLVQQEDLEIKLIPKSTEIQEARIVSNQLKRKTKGNKIRKSIVWVPFYSDTASLGYEIGTVIHLPDKAVILKDFNFFISYVVADSVKLRLNIYDYNNGIIGDNLLKKNIYFVLYKQGNKDYSIDLSGYKIVTNRDIFVALENVAGYTSNSSSTNNNQIKNDKQRISTMMFSATFTGSKGMHRKVSLGTWEKNPAGISPGFWVTILK